MRRTDDPWRTIRRFGLGIWLQSFFQKTFKKSCILIIPILFIAPLLVSCNLFGLKSARNLTGTWIGTSPNGAIYTDNASNPNCSYESDVRLTLVQNGNSLTGSFDLTVRKADKLLNTNLSCVAVGTEANQALFGSVSSSQFEFTLADNVTHFNGSYTSNILKASITSSANTGYGIQGSLTVNRK